ncbi:CsbD family protein, partial [uncultured Mycobacterium sp.]|uniref:CsbD family protein n=1 Tax=uncultured Mycobacterium sp. TaxID=171292 RepID=UPI0035CC26D9
MSGTDKAKNKAQDIGGKAKEAVGKVTGDKGTRDEGKSDQAKSSVKDAGEKVKVLTGTQGEHDGGVDGEDV